MADSHKPMRHVPQRTCLATRTVQSITGLLRCVAVVAEDGRVMIFPDPQRKLPGRGAWITPTLEAWDMANKRRAFARAFKVSAAAVDAGPVRDYVESLRRP